MIVYIVETGEYRLSNYIDGVFDTLEGAKDFSEGLFKRSVEDEEWELTEDDGIWSEDVKGKEWVMTYNGSRYDDTCYWRVTKHDVQQRQVSDNVDKDNE